MSYQFRRNKIASFVCLAITSGISNSAVAEESDKNDKKQFEIEVIEVKGVRSSLTSALAAKRDSDSISDSIVAEEIGKSSDENIAQALSRVSGISLDRNGGDSQTVTVRGVQASLNDIKLNGVSMTSNTNNQAVDLSLFSADVLSRIDVIKSPSANQEEGSLGAAINLQTRAPLAVKKSTLVVSAESRYNDLKQDATPRFAITSILKLSDSFGISGSIFHDRQNVRKEEFNSNGWKLNADTTNDQLAFVDAKNAATGEVIPGRTDALITDAVMARLNIDEKVKKGGSFTFQLRPSAATDIRLDLSYSNQEIDHMHSQNRLNLLDRASGGAAPDITIALGDDNTANTVVSAFSKKPGTQNQSAVWVNNTETKIAGLQLKQEVGDHLIVNAKIGRSDTEQSFSDSFKVNWWSKNPNNPSNDPAAWCGANYINGPEGDLLPEFSYCSSWNNDDPSYIQLGQARAAIRDVSDVKDSAYLDFEYLTDNEIITSVEFGAKYTKRVKSVTADEALKKWNQFEENAANNTKDKIFADAIEGVEDSSATGGRFLEGIAPAGLPKDWLFPDVDQAIALAFPSGTEGVFISNPLKSWVVEEKTQGAYIQANYELLSGDVVGNFGVRYAKTEVEGNAASGYTFSDNVHFVADGTSEDKVIADVTDTNDYAEILPSFTVNYVGIEDVVIRASAARVLARPEINDLTPGFELRATNFNSVPNASGGNTQLAPFLADQADLSFEWYFEESALLSAALFYKDFKSFSYDSRTIQQFNNPVTNNCIVDRTGASEEEQPTITSPCANVNYSTTINGATAEIKGAEFMYQQHYDFLPGVLKHLGTSINYTYADSSAIIDPENADNPFNDLPFINTSKHSSNVTVYWENDDMSFRLAYAYRTKALSGAQDRFSSIIRDDRGTLDFSANFSLSKKLKLTFSASNLTGSYDKFINVLTDPSGSSLTKEFDGDLDSVPNGRIQKLYNYGKDYRLSLRYSF